MTATITNIYKVRSEPKGWIAGESKTQTCEEWIRENKPISGMPYSVNPLNTITTFLAKRIDKQQKHIDDVYKTKEINAIVDVSLVPFIEVVKQQQARIDKLEQLAVAQSIEIDKLMKLAGVK